MVCLTTLRPTRTAYGVGDFSKIEQVWEVTEIDAFKLTVILMLKSNLPFLLLLGNMMLKNT
jgi:hypothetical protein